MALDVHIFATLLLVLLMYFVWMDVALYYKLQSNRENLLVVQNYKAATAKSKAAEIVEDYYFDPFDPISVKLITLDHPNHYVYYPLSWWWDHHILHISDKLTFISPDMISASHVVVSLIGAKYLLSESLWQRRAAVLLFELRTFLDSFDGYIARARNHERGMVQVAGNWGYYLDGICDALGTTFFMVACWQLLVRCQPRRYVSVTVPKPISVALGKSFPRGTDILPMISTGAEPDQEPFLPGAAAPKHRTFYFRYGFAVTFCLALYQVVGSAFWNRYMQNYHQLLEIPTDPSHEDYQVETMRSAAFWIICWSWKLLNPHALMEIMLWGILFDKTYEVLTWLQFLGFLPLSALIVSSEIHLQTVSWKLWYMKS